MESNNTVTEGNNKDLSYDNPDNRSLCSSRNRKRKNKNKKKTKKRKYNIASSSSDKIVIPSTSTMASWAESFTTTVAWQFKHEAAYWKAKATALEYENKILHDIIHENIVLGGKKQTPDSDHAEASSDSSSEVENGDDQSVIIESSDEIVVSEKFVEFLVANAKYREDAKREREKFRGALNVTKDDDEMRKMEAQPDKADPQLSTDEFQRLYGKNWQKISSQEMILQAQFLRNSDMYKPSYWPNIPLNFG